MTEFENETKVSKEEKKIKRFIDQGIDNLSDTVGEGIEGIPLSLTDYFPKIKKLIIKLIDREESDEIKMTNESGEVFKFNRTSHDIYLTAIKF
ncbi:hypothetical protein PALS2_096 [Staphylococcus phage PALS_2]|nr:hypothetical protein PALS2_096 [Staphylococcus phage PALS_2]